MRGCSCRDILSLFQRKGLLLMGETFFAIRKDWQENLKNLRECEKYAKNIFLKRKTDKLGNR